MILTKKDECYFDLAEKISLLSNYPRVKIGSVIVHKNKVISFGCNTLKSHPLQKTYNKYRNHQPKQDYVHSEMSALINAKDYDLSKCKIYVFRLERNGRLGNCMPCRACMNALLDRGIEDIYYTINNTFEKLKI